MGVIGEMGAIGFQGRIGFIIVLMAPITLTSASADHSSPMGSEVFSSKYTPFRFFILIFVLCMRIMRARAQKPHPNEDN